MHIPSAETLEAWCESRLDEWATPYGAHAQKGKPQKMFISGRNIEALPKSARVELGKSKLSWI